MDDHQASLRRQAFRTLAAMEFRVGLYQWLTRVLPGAYGKPVWVLVAFAALPLASVYQGTGVRTGPVVYALWLAAGVVVACWTLAVLIPSELGRPRPAGSRRGPSADPGGLHLLRLLPVAPIRRESATLAGRLWAIGVAIAVGVALLLAADVAARLTGRPALPPFPLAKWSLAAVSLWVVWCASRQLAHRRLGGYRWAAAIALYATAWPSLLTKALFWTVLAPHGWHGVWVPASAVLVGGAAWVLSALLLAGAHTVARRAVLRWRVEPRLPGLPLLDLATWREAWGRLGVPEAGSAAWRRASGQVLGPASAALALVVGLPWLAQVLRHPHAPGPWSSAVGFCLIALPLGAIPLVLVLWPGDFGPTPTPQFAPLLPLLPRDLWRFRLRAATAYALGFAGAAEFLALVCLGLAHLLGHPLTLPPAGMLWSPLVVAAAALLLWAQAPLLTHPFRIWRRAEWLWLAMVVAAVCPAAIAAFTLNLLSPVRLPLAVLLLWAATMAQLWLSRRAVDPNSWHLDQSGRPTAAAKAAFFGVAASSAISLALLAFCCVVTVSSFTVGQ